MAQTDFDSLVNVLASSKQLFWHDNANLSEPEIQRLWQLRWNHLGSQIGGTKRSNPRTLSVGGPRPSKRQELVGLLCPFPPTLGLTGGPEPFVLRT